MIIFAWKGFPQYAARCIGAFVKATTEKVVVVATRPKVPVEGMEKAAGCPVIWIEREGQEEGQEIAVDEKTTLLVAGWTVPAFNRLRERVRVAGGRVYCMNDGNCVITPMEILRAIRFRLCCRKWFDGYFVPGKSGRRLMRLYGVADDCIEEGLYSADESLFDPRLAAKSEKEKRIVYVGQYIGRKNVLAVCKAFEESGIAAQGWSLEMYGSGPLKSQIPYAQPFVQPEQLPEIYRRAKAFILASKEEHWGLVVHEAALSGCYLMLSDRVGAAEDLLTPQNGIVFSPFSIRQMTNAFRRLAEFREDEWEKIRSASLEMAARRGLSSFVGGLQRLLKIGGHK